MTGRLTFDRVARLERKAARPATRQPGDVTRERLIQSGALVPAELALDGRTLHAEDSARDRPVLRLDDLGKRVAKRDIRDGRRARHMDHE